MTRPDGVTSFLHTYPRDVKVLAAATRRMVKRVLPGTSEAVDTSRKLIFYRYGPGYKGLVCTLILSRTGLKLGIVRGAELRDPEGLLRGQGRVHRHVQLTEVADLKHPGLAALLRSALVAWRRRAGTNK